MSDQKRRDKKGRLLQKGESQEKNGRYKYRYTDTCGKRKTVYSWRLTQADPIPPNTKKDTPLRELEKEIQSMSLQGVSSSDLTVIELVDRYLYTKTGVKPNTKVNYNFVRNILKKESFGSKKIDKIKISDAKIFLIKLQNNGKGYSSIHSIRGVLRPAFQMAVEDDLLIKNPFEFKLGTVIVNDSVERQPVPPELEKKFLEFVKNDSHYQKYYDAFFILFKTGLRISEFCGLTIKDIDFENNYINVDHQLQRMRDMSYVVDSTKTTSGTRKLPMSEEVREAFRRIIKSRPKIKVEPMVDGYAGFLFLDKNFKPMVALHWEKYMKRAVDKYNATHQIHLPHITPHVCRHTYCSNMAMTGINPKALQYLRGHADIGVTMNTYTHVGYEDAKSELERLSKDSKTTQVVKFG